MCHSVIELSNTTELYEGEDIQNVFQVPSVVCATTFVLHTSLSSCPTVSATSVVIVPSPCYGDGGSLR